jgi:hypothetical protein
MISLRDVKYKLRHKGDKIIFVNPTILLDKLEKTSYGVRQPSGQIGNRGMIQEQRNFQCLNQVLLVFMVVRGWNMFLLKMVDIVY